MTWRNWSAWPSAFTGRAVRLLQGDYDFPTLKRFKEIALSIHGTPGVVYTDADEARNRLSVGVVDSVAAQRALAALAQLGVPKEAVLTTLRTVNGIRSSLLDHQAVSVGALGITVADPNQTGRHCTIGYVAYVASEWWVPQDLQGVRFAMTNSHCGGTQPQWMGTATNAPAYQYVSFPQNLIGNEEFDPGFSGLVFCPLGRRCRYSDAAAYRLTNQGLADPGTVARTLGPPTYQTTNSLTIDPANPTFTVVTAPGGGEYWVPTGGTVYKIGSATGWTYGSISATCRDVNMFEFGVDLGATLLCQNSVLSRNAGGDSGSPVFTMGAGNTIHAVGLLWGGGTLGSGLEEFDYSRMDYVLWEFEQADLPELRLVHP